MPLTLVTGPANAEKAGVVMARLRALLDREPFLVVPTFPDAERYRRELAEDEALVFGVRVETFARLSSEVARRAGAGGRPLGLLARDRVAVAAARDARLERLAASARTPGFARAAARLFEELEEERIDPARWTAALRAWAADDAGRRAYAEELAALYRCYRARLEHLGRPDPTLHATAALDALRTEPARWGGTPVLLYGFDDLTPLQRDTVLTLAATEAPVVVSLPHEPGRHAFAARAETYEALRPAATERIELEARAEHYEPQARAALHHLERRLFEDAAPLGADAAGEPAPPSLLDEPFAAGDAPTLFDDVRARRGSGGGTEPAQLPSAAGAVTFLEGGGERAELELVAAECARLIREEGFAPDEIAVVARRPDEAAASVAQVFGAYGVPVAVGRRTRLGHTPLGRGLLALLRAATGGTAADVVAWLRTPGLVRRRAFVDVLEADVRRHGDRTAAAARERWERRHPDFPLEALDRVARAADAGPVALLERLADELASLFAAPHRRRAPVLDGAQADDARVLRAGRRALTELAELAAADASLAPEPGELAQVLEAVPVVLGERALPGAVQFGDPLSLRARRVRALFACRLQEGVFPAPARPEPFLDDAERRRLNAASGLRLRAHEDALGAERYLLYATVSRPEASLFVSWHTATDDGDPVVRSAFVDDVAALFADVPVRRRSIGAVGWPGGAAPSEREALREAAHAEPRVAEPVAAPLRHPDVLAALRERRAWSASGLETWAGCPVKWFVQRLLRPDGLEPDPEMLVRGGLAHAVLERALRQLVNGGGLNAERLPEARAAVRSALEDLRGEFAISVDPARRRALTRRLEADLLRYVEAAAASRSAFTPTHFEVRFEGLDIGDGVCVDGQIDRVDVRGNEAIVYDYKGKTAPPGAKWVEEGRFQLAVYALAARRVLGLEPVGALYQPLGADSLTPRGALVEDADPDLVASDRDRLPREQFDALVAEAVGAAVEAAREARAGALRPQPDSCAWNGGCEFPTICRCEA